VPDKKAVLVIAAHPDDEVLGCGATIARLAGEGHDVYIAILAEGITSRFAERKDADAGLLTRLHQDCRNVASILGAKDVSLYGLPDNRMDTVALLDVVKIVEDLVERLKPSDIYTHHPGDLNVDHQVTFRAVMTATRPMPGQPVRNVYTFEVMSSTEWAFQHFAPEFRPNVFMDVATTLETKIRAMSVYESEARPFPHPRSADSLRAYARRWGSVSGCEAAEAFELIRSVR
jgi:LmbE family N-acetylglucosaminyl deacetylase